MNKGRIVSIMLLVLLLAGMIVPVSAADTPKVTVGEARVDQAQGNTVTVPVSIENNPGFSGMDLTISIPDGWRITDIEIRTRDAYSIFYQENKYGDMSNVITPIINVDNDGIGKFVAAYGAGEFTEDGYLFWITYEVPENTENGLYDVAVTPVKINTQEDTATNIADDFIFTDSTGETPESPEKEEPSGGNTADDDQVIPTRPNKPTTSEPEEEIAVFHDIDGNWAEDYILEAAERGLVNGKGEGIFDPNANMTRAEFMMILWRVMGSPTPSRAASFTDLTQAWYLEPIAWAEERGITNGTSPTTFDPQGNVTREQMMTILHRLAGTPIGMESIFALQYDQQMQDSENVSSWAKNAIHWSIFHGILCGEQSVKLGNIIAPSEAATRSQIAVSIIRYLDR